MFQSVLKASKMTSELVVIGCGYGCGYGGGGGGGDDGVGVGVCDGGGGDDDDDAVRLSRIPPQCGFCQATHWPAQLILSKLSFLRSFVSFAARHKSFFFSDERWMDGKPNAIYIYIYICTCVCVYVCMFGLLCRNGP